MKTRKVESGSICGGNHQSKVWTKKEIFKHMENPEDVIGCIDCMCGIPFKSKRKGYEWVL